MPYTKKRIGDLLIEEGYITEEQLERALKEQKKTGEPIGKILVDMGFVTKDALNRVLNRQYGLDWSDLKLDEIDPSLKNIMPVELVAQYRVIPFRDEGRSLQILMVPPRDKTKTTQIIEDLMYRIGKRITPIMIDEKTWLALFEQLYVSSDRVREVLGVLTEETAPEEYNIIVTEQEIAEIKTKFANINPQDIISDNFNINDLLKFLLYLAVEKEGITDMHLEPMPGFYRVRYRIDGVLEEKLTLPLTVAEKLIVKIKSESGIDIAERRRPQDGHFTAKILSGAFDIRVATVGTVHGEQMVLRFLNKNNAYKSLTRLGMLEPQLETFKRLLRVPYGILLVTGPTGSGKTTTLYAGLSSINDSTKKIITIEDPVEYDMPDAQQINVNTKAGITFASVLRSILRLDPDIILVGEIRDEDTAKTAIEAALTGHLVLATLHTNDAPSAIVRLQEMGVDNFLLSSALVGVVAQRLVRLLVPNCRNKGKLIGIENPNEIKIREIRTEFDCIECPIYEGRTGIFELFEVNDEIEELIMRRAPLAQLREAARNNGMITMLESGIYKVKEGITTIEEVMRVVKADEDRIAEAIRRVYGV